MPTVRRGQGSERVLCEQRSSRRAINLLCYLPEASQPRIVPPSSAACVHPPREPLSAVWVRCRLASVSDRPHCGRWSGAPRDWRGPWSESLPRCATRRWVAICAAVRELQRDQAHGRCRACRQPGLHASGSNRACCASVAAVDIRAEGRAVSEVACPLGRSGVQGENGCPQLRGREGALGVGRTTRQVQT